MKSNTVLVILFLMYYKILSIDCYSSTLIKPSFTKEHLKWVAFYKNRNTGVKNEETHKSEYIASMIYKRKSDIQPANKKSNAALLWDKKNCLPKSTAVFPVPDCKKYIKCNKGQGSLNSCAVGTLFNPNSLKCDSPEKVQCLNRNSSVFESLFPNKSLSQNFDLNTQSTDQHQPQYSNPLPGTQFIVDLLKSKENNFIDYSNSAVTISYRLLVGGNKPLVGSNIVVNQHLYGFPNQYQPRSTNPLPGSQFVVDLQKTKENNFTDYSDSAMSINYSLPVGDNNKPLVGSNIVVSQESTSTSSG